MRNLRQCILLLFASTALCGQTFTRLASFYGANGSQPYFEALVQGKDGSLYGTTESGGNSKACKNGCGTIFRFTPGGTLESLASFDQTDGASPYAGLILGTDGEYYGMAYAGGTGGDGTVFKMSPAGALTSLHSFSYLV